MSLINDTIIILISVLHILVILFVILIPFSNNDALMFLHVVIVPFIIIHWIYNNNNCCLSVAEKHIRRISHGTKSSTKDTFIYQFIAPIYDFNKNHEQYSAFIYIITLLLWSVSLYNINNNFNSGKINNYNQLFTI
jgi:c-di-AMP phosphodiesterase-like protein